MGSCHTLIWVLSLALILIAHSRAESDVRFEHAWVGGAPVTLCLQKSTTSGSTSGSPIFEDVSYGTVTGYDAFLDGSSSYSFFIVPSTGTCDPSQSLMATNVTTKQGDRHTISVVGTPTTSSLLVYQDTSNSSQVSDHSWVRFVNQMPELGSAASLWTGAVETVENVGYPNSSAYYPFFAGGYFFSLSVPVGKDQQQFILNATEVSVEGGVWYTLFAIGINSTNVTDDYRLLFVQDSYGNPTAGAPSSSLPWWAWFLIGFGVIGIVLILAGVAIVVWRFYGYKNPVTYEQA